MALQQERMESEDLEPAGALNSPKVPKGDWAGNINSAAIQREDCSCPPPVAGVVLFPGEHEGLLLSPRSSLRNSSWGAFLASQTKMAKTRQNSTPAPVLSVQSGGIDSGVTSKGRQQLPGASGHPGGGCEGGASPAKDGQQQGLPGDGLPPSVSLW